MDLWDFIEQLADGKAKGKNQPQAIKPPPAPPPPAWETTSRIFIIHRQHCVGCGSVVDFADCTGRVMIERRRRSDGAIHIHELPEGTIPGTLARKFWIEEHHTAWCPQCMSETSPGQLPLPFPHRQPMQFTLKHCGALIDCIDHLNLQSTSITKRPLS